MRCGIREVLQKPSSMEKALTSQLMAELDCGCSLQGFNYLRCDREGALQKTSSMEKALPHS
ncbi:hypothetical protein CK203_075244 [Vitis vinifera]|uniref:Uncharacterized protein n=1 Tax=Vitis vinifera TaxID=29760 RepID=A0A438F6F5_VITVI|nr:hypothetical protein CK203_075244 [Vitis vinifera]